MSVSHPAKASLVELYLKIVDLRCIGDFAGLSEYLLEDTEIHYPSVQGGLSWGGKRIGVDAIIARAKMLDADIEVLNREHFAMVHEGDTLAVRFFMRIANRASSGEAAFEGIDFVTFKDDKLLKFIEYFDTHAVMRMLAEVR